jgi:D-alanine transaminase/branched-chain amino acid aminotransferase
MVDQQNTLVTPANNILEGITRKTVLELAKGTYSVQERDILVDELHIAREAFLTSTTKSIMPITEIDGRQIGDGGPGPVTSRLAELMHQLPHDFKLP